MTCQLYSTTVLWSQGSMQVVSSTVAVSCCHNSTYGSAQMCAGYPWLPEPEQKAAVPAAVTEDAICPVSSILQKPSMADQPVPASQVTQTLTRMVYLYSVRLTISKALNHKLLAAEHSCQTD